MSSVLTLIANPASPSLDQRITDAAIDALKAAYDVGDVTTSTLQEGVAIDLFYDGHAGKDVARHVAAQLNAPLDIASQPTQGRQKKLLIADMDSTIIQQECLDELADFAGVKDKVSEITERAMQGELDFEAALKERVAMLKDLPTSTLEDTLATRIKLTPGAETLVRTMNKLGAMTALVSGGFTFFTHRIAQAVGFQDNQGNILLDKDGYLTGLVEEPILGREAKLEALLNHCDMEGITPAEALAVGDGANDLAMITKAGMGVAFHAKPTVASEAGFKIDHGDLTALLFLQGVSHEDFATA
jgi:phosphoserine phosphatase